MAPKELGYDELSAVLKLAAGDSIDDKFRLSHVCRFWRTVALTTPRFWTCFSVRTMADVLRLPVVIDRAGPRKSVPMDITLDFSARKTVQANGLTFVVPLIEPEDRLGIYRDLAPRLPFVHRLCIKFGATNSNLGANEPISRLFTVATPALEQLAVFFSTVSDDPTAQQPVLPLVATSRLRISGLEPDVLVRILATCPRLTRLTFLPTCRYDFAFHARSFNTKLQRLRALHIGGPFINIWSTISPMLCPEVLESITVSIPKDSPAGIAAHIGQSIFPDAWSPVSCAVSTLHWPFHPRVQKGIRLVDGAGKERHVLAACPAPPCFGDLWRSLVVNTNALDTIASFALSAMPADWAEVCDAFHADPPRHPAFQLRVPLRRRDALQFAAQRLSGTLRCPTVQRVTFEMDDDRGLELLMVLAVIDHIAHENTTLCVVDAFAENPDRVWVSDWLVMLEEELSQRNGWALCRHCVDHIN
ncbi:hypothetical protein AURDEDRAFT_169815 [Auricularia subglabra TFB-10046 SS5]|nr:hypothetical protein AURDEDRAFT_169815 [Auricularia subglabra TFB-10046 SS5]